LAIPKEIAKEITLDLKGIPRSERSTVKKEVGDFVTEEILRELSQGKSPVEGEGDFKSLNTEYAKEKKGGNTTPNLELDGDMLDALEYKNTRNGIKVGVFKKSEVPKAYGHNSGFKGHPWLEDESLKRQFIPEDDQKFKSRIEAGIKDIVNEYKRQDSDGFKINVRNLLRGRPPREESTPRSSTQVELTDILSDQNLASFLLGDE
jgi:hypothetical protein